MSPTPSLMQYSTETPLRVVTLCSGYDSQCLALERLKEQNPGFDYELVAWSEIDAYAIKAHNALFPQWADRNLGDMTKIDWTKVAEQGKGIDLLTYSTPCTDISNAGLQKGLEEGSDTRSSILWYTREAIRILRPKFLLLENVKALTSEKFMPFFAKWQLEVETYGYKNFWQVLNAKDYGVPQNRERVFMVSIRRDESEQLLHYEFPKPFKLEKRLRDVLEPEVDESFYLRQEQVDRIIAHCDRKVAEGCGFKTNFQDEDGLSGAIKTKEGSREYDTYIKE